MEHYEKVVGIQSYQSTDGRLSIGSKVKITHEEDNKFSSKALKVSFYGNTLGYIGERSGAHQKLLEQVPIGATVKTLTRKEEGKTGEFLDKFEDGAVTHLGVVFELMQVDGERDANGFYHKKGKKYKSVTTFLKNYPSSPEPIIRWALNKVGGKVKEHKNYNIDFFKTYEEILNQTAVNGTAMHDGFEDILLGKKKPREGTAFYSFLEKYKPEVIAIEDVIYDEELEIAGRFDFMGNIDGKRVLIDWKSSSSYQEKHGIQGSIYAHNLEEVDEVWIVRFYLNGGKAPKCGYSVKKINKETWQYMYDNIVVPLHSVLDNAENISYK